MMFIFSGGRYSDGEEEVEEEVEEVLLEDTKDLKDYLFSPS